MTSSSKQSLLEHNRLKLAFFNKRQQLGLSARATGVTEQDPCEGKYSPSGNLSGTSAPSRSGGVGGVRVCNEAVGPPARLMLP